MTKALDDRDIRPLLHTWLRAGRPADAIIDELGSVSYTHLTLPTTPYV